MLDRTTKQQDDCPHCGEKTLLTRRVSAMQRGYVNIFECQACGRISHKDVPHQAPRK